MISDKTGVIVCSFFRIVVVGERRGRVGFDKRDVDKKRVALAAV